MGDADEGRAIFRASVMQWVQAAVAQATLSDVFVDREQVWEATPQKTMLPREQYIAQWAPSFYARIFDLPEWDTVRVNADEWPALKAHIDKLVGAPGGSYARFSLAFALEDLVPQPAIGSNSGLTLPRFDEREFDRQFDGIACFIETANITYTLRRVLLGLRAPEEALPLRLSRDVSIERLSSADVRSFGDPPFQFDLRPFCRNKLVRA